MERFAHTWPNSCRRRSASGARNPQGFGAQEKRSLPPGSTARRCPTRWNTTLITFDALMKRFGVGEPHTNTAASAINATPVPHSGLRGHRRPREVTARQLTELLATHWIARSDHESLQLSARSSRWFSKRKPAGRGSGGLRLCRALLFVGVVLTAALIYRFISFPRLFSKTTHRENPRLISVVPTTNHHRKLPKQTGNGARSLALCGALLRWRWWRGLDFVCPAPAEARGETTRCAWSAGGAGHPVSAADLRAGVAGDEERDESHARFSTSRYCPMAWRFHVAAKPELFHRRFTDLNTNGALMAANLWPV